MEELKLSRSEKAAFSSLADELRGMERAMRSALKAVEKTGSQAYNVTNETKFSRKGSQNGREENRGNEETGRQEGSDTGGRSQVQGTVQRVSGRAGLVLSAQEASKGQRPAVAFNESDVVEPVEGSVVYANQTAKAAISEYQTDSWMQKADEAEKKYGISQEMYISIRTNASGLKSLKDADGNTITNSLSLLKMKLVYDTPGLNEKQRQAMFEYLGVGKKVQHYNKALVEQKLQEMRKKAQ